MEAFTNRINLPDDIWLQVFMYLSLEDRKHIRSTCNRFNRLCENACILNKEEIVLYTNIHICSAVRVLSETSKIIRNIKLMKVLIDKSVLPLFEKHKSSLRSVHFEDCWFSPGAFKSVIERCSSICCFTLKFDPTFYYLKCIRGIFNDLDTLEKMSVVCNSVTDLKIRIPLHRDFYNGSLLRFFDVFPNVKKLNFKINECRYPPHVAITYSTVSSSVLSNRILAMSDQLEELSLSLGDQSINASLVIELLDKISNSKIKKWKKLSLSWVCFYVNDLSLLNPLVNFKHVTHFNFIVGCIPIEYRTLPTPSPEIVSTFLQKLLSNTELISLKISADTLLIDQELFQALVKSKLKKLRIKSERVVFNFRPSSLENVLMPNHHLQYLHVDKIKSSEKLLFANNFPSLRHLKFSSINDRILNNIFILQTQIRSLKLYNYSSDMNFDFMELSPLQRWFENEVITNKLKYLTCIRIHEGKYSLTCFLLSQFLFPNLKSLFITIFHAEGFDEEQFWRLFQNLPRLEYLRVELPVASSVEQLPSFLNGLAKLRYFCVQNSSENINIKPLARYSYDKLFQTLPSLRMVFHSEVGALFPMDFIFHFYDVVTKKVSSFYKTDETCTFGECKSMADLQAIRYGCHS